MRFSNLQYGKGSIVYARFRKEGELAFLNDRPLIVISNPIHILDCIWICATGSQNKPGIQCSLYNYYKQSYIGDNKITNIYPNSVYTINTNSIYECIGILDPYIMKQVDSAIDFFRGQSDIIPEFMREYSDDLYGVMYTSATPHHIRQNEKVRKNSNLHIRLNEIDDKYKMTENNSKPATDKEDILQMWISNTNNLLEYRNFIDDNGDIDSLTNYFSDMSKCVIISRLATLKDIGIKYAIGTFEAFNLRENLTSIAITYGKSVLGKNEIKTVQQFLDIFNNQLFDFEKLSLILVVEFNILRMNIIRNNIKNTLEYNEILNKYKIQSSNGKIWKSLITKYKINKKNNE